MTGLSLTLVRGSGELSRIWKDLLIDQHPCGDAPLVGAQVRYLIGSDHGWLGAIGFSSASFVLKARDEWIGWTASAREQNRDRVINLSRVLIRQEVRCKNLASKVLSMCLKEVQKDWTEIYRIEPLLVETFVDRSYYNGRSLAAANWERIGESSGRGRMGEAGSKSIKDIWVYPLHRRTRALLQDQEVPPVQPRSITESLGQEEWVEQELESLQLGDKRLNKRAQLILQRRDQRPQASFYGSFADWKEAKSGYNFIANPKAPISMESLLEAHEQASLQRMAAEPVVLLAQDTTTLNYSGLKTTTGLGTIGDKRSPARGLLLHTTLAYRPDGIPLGIAKAHCWARPKDYTTRDRNAKSIGEKESWRWVESLQTCAAAARRMPAVTLVNIADREGDLYELYDAVHQGSDNVHVLVRAKHNRNLESHEKLWARLMEQPVAGLRTFAVPRKREQPARNTLLSIQYCEVIIEPPKVGSKKSWKPLRLWAVLVREPNPPEGVAPIEWMLLTDMPIANEEQAWEKVEWYRVRWGIEEFHRCLKSGCEVEAREFKTAEHLKRSLALDMILAWRILACVKLGRVLPQLPATVIYSEDELIVLNLTSKKNS